MGFVGEPDQGVGFPESLVRVGPVLGMADINVGRQPFGQQVNLKAKAFDQHAAMALDLFDPAAHFVESVINPFEPLVDLLKPSVDLLKSPVHLLESSVDPLELAGDLAEPFVEVLNKFLIHVPSVS